MPRDGKKKKKKVPPHNARRAADLGLQQKRKPPAEYTTRAKVECPSYGLLPFDILRLIFLLIAPYPRLTTISTVCKRWRTLALEMVTLPEMKAASTSPKVFFVLPSITELVISKPVAHVPRSLRRLELCGNERWKRHCACLCQPFCDAAEEIHLESLSLTVSSVCCCFPIIANCNRTSLASLTLALDDLSAEERRTISAVSIPSLRHLTISSRHDDVAFALAMNHPQLTSLHFETSTVSDSFYNVSLISLTHLHVNLPVINWPRFIAQLHVTTSLTSLSLETKGHNALLIPFTQIAPLLTLFNFKMNYGSHDISQPLGVCKRLAHLSVDLGRTVGVEALLLPHTNTLRSLHLHCGDHMALKWFYAVASCTALTDLRLSNCDGALLTPFLLVQHSLPSLRSLDITLRSELSLEGHLHLLSAFLNICPRLQSIRAYLPRTTTRRHTEMVREFLETAEKECIQRVCFVCRAVSAKAVRLMMRKFRWLKVDIECAEEEENDSSSDDSPGEEDPSTDSD